MVTSNKRNLIYNSDDVFIDTAPLIVNEDSLEKPSHLSSSIIPFSLPSFKNFSYPSLSLIPFSHIHKYQLPSLSLIPFSQKNLFLIIVKSNNEMLSVNTKNILMHSYLNIDNLCIYAEKIIQDSNMLACNEAIIKLFQLTGFMYSSNGDVHYLHTHPGLQNKALGKKFSNSSSKFVKLVYIGVKRCYSCIQNREYFKLNIVFSQLHSSYFEYLYKQKNSYFHSIKNNKLLEYLYKTIMLIFTLTLQIQNPDLDFDYPCFNEQYTLNFNLNLDD